MSGCHYLHNHPPGSWFIRIDAWVLEILGHKEHAAAACFSLLEFWQRSLPDGSDGWVRRGPVDFSAKLSHLYGKDSVRKGLNLLVMVGWIDEDEETSFVGQLWQRRKKFRLRITKINQAVEDYEKNKEKSKECDFSPPGNTKNRLPDGDKSAPRQRKVGVKKYMGAALDKAEVDEVELGKPAASIFIVENKQDDLLLEGLVEQHGLEGVEAEARALIKAGVRPYLSSIRKSLIEKAAAVKREAAEKRRSAALAAPLVMDPEVLARGEAEMKKVRQRSTVRSV